MVAKKSPNSYSHLWLFHATILDAGTHFRLSAAFGLNLGCHFSDIFSFSLAESPAASQLDWLLEELLGYHNPYLPVNTAPEFLVSALQLESNPLLCLP